MATLILHTGDDGIMNTDEFGNKFINVSNIEVIIRTEGKQSGIIKSPSTEFIEMSIEEIKDCDGCIDNGKCDNQLNGKLIKTCDGKMVIR